MQLSGIPVRFQKVWAVNAAGAYIRVVPVNSQIGVQDGAASFNDGFVPDNFSPVSAGGVPPFGQDFNGLLNVMTAWQQWGQAGGAIPYDGTFAAAIGGYPKGAVLDSAVVLGAQWYSTADNNLTDPDDPLTSSGWIRVGIPVGTLVPFTFSVPTGFVAATGLNNSIGSAASGAVYAAADALFLFVINWPNSQLSIFTSAGAPTTRGANAVADFVANKRLSLPEGRGTGLIGVDSGGSTFLSGVPVIGGNTTTPGSTVGENLHQLTISEIAQHNHGGLTGSMNSNTVHNHGFTAVFLTGGPAGITTGGVAAPATTTTSVTDFANIDHNHNIANQGGNGSHNTAHRSLTVLWGQKL